MALWRRFRRAEYCAAYYHSYMVIGVTHQLKTEKAGEVTALSVTKCLLSAVCTHKQGRAGVWLAGAWKQGGFVPCNGEKGNHLY